MANCWNDTEEKYFNVEMTLASWFHLQSRWTRLGTALRIKRGKPLQRFLLKLTTFPQDSRYFVAAQQMDVTRSDETLQQMGVASSRH